MAFPLALDLGILALFLAASGFFSLSETALIAVPRHQVRRAAEAGDARARLADHMMDEPERVLSTVLIGNNLVNIGATAYATVVALRVFGDRGALIATGVMAVLIVLVSEIIPKTLSVQRPLPIALAVARPLRVVESLLKPLVLMVAGMSRFVAKAAGGKNAGSTRAPFITSDEIEMLVREGVKEGEVEHFEEKVIRELFDFTETDVHKIMTPADQIHYLDRSATLRQASELAREEGRTRILVVDLTFDRVMGFVHIKDLLHLEPRGVADLPVTKALRPVLVAPHDTPADRLLVRMQKAHRLMAVIQEGNRNIGIVTLEDLLEELVGDLKDEVAMQGAAQPQASVMSEAGRRAAAAVVDAPMSPPGDDAAAKPPPG